jgi:hypothetical protein
VVIIPPFPVFMIRDLNELLGVHHHGRRASSLERERESNLMEDVTWGGLFPRAASCVSFFGFPATSDDFYAVLERAMQLEFLSDERPEQKRLVMPVPAMLVKRRFWQPEEHSHRMPKTQRLAEWRLNMPRSCAI